MWYPDGAPESEEKAYWLMPVWLLPLLQTGCRGCLSIGLGRIVCCLCRVLVRGSGGHAVRAGCTSGCLGASGCCAGAISLFCRDCVGRSHRLRAGALSISTLAV